MGPRTEHKTDCEKKHLLYVKHWGYKEKSKMVPTLKEFHILIGKNNTPGKLQLQIRQNKKSQWALRYSSKANNNASF